MDTNDPKNVFIYGLLNDLSNSHNLMFNGRMEVADCLKFAQNTNSSDVSHGSPQCLQANSKTCFLPHSF